MNVYLSKLIFLSLLVLSCQSPEKNSVSCIKGSQKPINTLIAPSGTNIVSRFRTPKNCTREKISIKSFAHYLRNIKLKPYGSEVSYYNGDKKTNKNIYVGVFDLAIGDKNLHQCADAVMRLHAEHLWKQKRYEDIHFNFTNGFTVNYSEWMKGKRMNIQGNNTSWNNRYQPSNTYEDFWSYMELILSLIHI